MAAANDVFINDFGFFSSMEDQYRPCCSNLDSFHQRSQDLLDRLLWEQGDDALPFLEHYTDEPFDLPPLNNIGPQKELPPAPPGIQSGEVNLPERDETLMFWCEPTMPDPLFQEVEIPESLEIFEPDDFILTELNFPLQYCNSKGYSCRRLDEEQLSVGFENLIVTPPRSRSNSLRSKEVSKERPLDCWPIQGVAEDRPELAVVESNKPVEPITLQCINVGETSLLDDGDGSQNGKRERSMSFEVLSKYYCRTKLQKEKDLVSGRPRRTSIRETPHLCYGLRPLQCLMIDIDSSVYKLVMNLLATPRHWKGAVQLLNMELTSLATDPYVTPDLVLAILQVLQAKSIDQLSPAVNLSLFKDIVSLKEVYLSMLSELESNELRTEGCLKEEVTKYSSIHSTTTFGDVKVRLMKALYEKYRAMILQSFRDMVLSLSTATPDATFVQLPLCMASNVPFAVDSPPPDLLQRAAKYRLENGLPDSSIVVKPKIHVGAPRSRALSGARGCLPKAAADEMRAWLLDHFDKPKPSRQEKAAFAKKWKITMKQVEDWFVNARARFVKPIALQLWKEMHPEKAAEIL